MKKTEPALWGADRKVFCDGGENRGRNPGSDPSGTSKKKRVHAKSGRKRPKGTVSCHEH